MRCTGAMHMKLSIDPEASAPPFEQLRRQVIDAVADGSLAARHPACRRCAHSRPSSASPSTRSPRRTARSRTDHVIETRGRAGTFVSATGDAVTREAQLAAIAFADRVHHLGVDRETALALVESALDAER